MRRMAMQVMTWGTIVGAIVSALLLAALDRSPSNYSVAVPLAQAWQALEDPTQPAGARPFGVQPAAPPAPGAASAPSFARP